VFDFFADFVLQLFVLDEELDLPLDGAVPVVLDGVVGAAAEELGDDGPSVAKTGLKGRLHAVGLHDGDVLLLRPPFLLDARVQVVVPPKFSTPLPLSALLADPTRQVLRDERPVLWAVSQHQL
jgi:hypothetical protein